ncbi:MAG: hypothetical protein ACJ761_01950 [Chloroflexota bacterium]
MADLPIDLGDELADRLASVLDAEGKIPRALEALGPVGERDVTLLDGAGGLRARQLEELGARVQRADESAGGLASCPAASADVVVACWTSFRGFDDAELTQAERVVRPGGRLLVVHDYGRDDISRLRGDRPEYGDWSRRDGPFLTRGFKIRVIHCWWTFADVDSARSFLEAAFGETGRDVAAGLNRPRLSYNIAVYHRTMGVPSG